MSPDLDSVFATLDATWPSATQHRAGQWLVREGQGGGKRVSAATAIGPVDDDGITAMEALQAGLGQPPLVMIRGEDTTLDTLLARRAYQLVDPVVAYCAPIEALCGETPHLTAFGIWPPLAIQRELWSAGGIGPERVEVMARVQGPKTAILGRALDRPAGVAFVGIHQGIAMVHALEVSPAIRRQKAALHMMRFAANWARENGARHISLVVTEANAPARALYASLGMRVVGHYHYRLK